MANEASTPLTPHYQCHPGQSVGVLLMGSPDELQSSEHPPGADIAGSYTSMSLADYAPPVGYNSNMEYDDAPRPATDITEHRGNQDHRGNHLTPGVTQYNLAVPAPPKLENYIPVAPEMPNDGSFNRGPLPHRVERPTQGNTSSVHFGISATKDIKHLASRYLDSPSSQVESFRMSRSRTGGFKVLIVLDIDDTM